jgi:C-terminal processing protease CtpA/Prc
METQQQSQKITLEILYKTMRKMQQELHEIKEIVVERIDDEGELTEEALTKLEEARKTPLTEYVDHEGVAKEFSEDEE